MIPVFFCLRCHEKTSKDALTAHVMKCRYTSGLDAECILSTPRLDLFMASLCWHVCCEIRIGKGTPQVYSYNFCKKMTYDILYHTIEESYFWYKCIDLRSVFMSPPCQCWGIS